MNKNKLLIAAALLLLTVGMYFLFFYGKGNATDTASHTYGDTTGQLDAVDQEIQARRERLLKEQGNPVDYVTVTIDPKKNLFGESVIEGNLKNVATATRYKDFELMLYWQDEAGAVMDSAAEIVFEAVDPGETVAFHTKRKGPRKSKSIVVKLRSAKAVAQ